MMSANIEDLLGPGLILEMKSGVVADGEFKGPVMMYRLKCEHCRQASSHFHSLDNPTNEPVVVRFLTEHSCVESGKIVEIIH